MKAVLKFGALIGAIIAVGCVNVSVSDRDHDEESAALLSAQDASAVVIDNILTRRSIRDYRDEPVCRDQMAKVLECGMYAPNAMNKQTWAVRVVDAPDFIEGVTAIAVEQMPQLREQPNFRNFFRNAPTVAFIACPEQSYSGEYDCGLLSQNMMLSAWSMGIGSCCLGSVVPVMNSDAAKPYLERLLLPEGYKLLMAIAFGYPAVDTPAPTPRDMTKGCYIE